ncbi:hypothetical protein [Paenibacillus odorifer]|jgi:hypothetical protein|uniref:hypothetical protein n=1 Tax=Paenibacillus odorifer TaxID=189426 RepID=UPI0015C30A63|nr:hypothetical protein [Paenibacillus odorifer]
MGLSLILIDAEYDNKGYCLVINEDLKNLLSQNGISPIESGISHYINSKYWKYQTQLTSEQLDGMFNKHSKDELVRDLNKLNEIISQWNDAKYNDKYNLKRWEM